MNANRLRIGIGIGVLAMGMVWLGVDFVRGQAQSPQGQPGQASPFSAMQQREQEYNEPVYVPPDSDLRWPLAAADQAYASINGGHLREYVKELTEISHRSRDRGDQLWGRITGMRADAETAQWMMEKLRQVGVTDVHNQELDLPPQWVAKSWDVTASGNGKSVKLESAQPMVRTPGTSNVTEDLEAVYVGLGSEADFAGREVKGKAVFIYSVPLPGSWQHTATRYGAPKRAEDRGAAAIFLVIGLPGNFRTEPNPVGTHIPTFTLGSRDGATVRELIEQSPAGQAPRVKVRSDLPMVSGEKTSLVWGVIPGLTDEKIVINAHRDGYWEAANDNATGVATAIGLAEYFVRMPVKKRRRTIIIIGNPGHHNTAVGSQWMVAHKDIFFDKAALLINSEHTGQVLTDLLGYMLVATNMPSSFTWYVGGGPKLEPIVIKDWDTFGVGRLAVPDSAPPGDIGQTYKLAPSLQLIQGTHFYHTDHDTLETIPPSGLEAVTRAYAKIIDDVNKVDLKDLAWPATQ